MYRRDAAAATPLPSKNAEDDTGQLFQEVLLCCYLGFYRPTGYWSWTEPPGMVEHPLSNFWQSGTCVFLPPAHPQSMLLALVAILCTLP